MNSLRVYVELGHRLGIDTWPERHAAGLVPDGLPFGLDKLRDHGMALRFRPDFSSRRVARLAQRANRSVAGLEWVEAAVLSDARDRRAADVVLAWDEWTGIPAAHRPRRGEPPVVSGIMNLTDWPQLRSHERHLLRAGMLRSAALFQHSAAQADLLVSDWGVPRDRIHLIPFGVDEMFFRPTGRSVDRDLIVTVGDDAHRDYPGLFRAYGRVRDARPATRLLAATTHPALSAPAPGVELVREKLGPRRPTVYSSAQVVAVLCHRQVHGSGLSVIVEAMACGRPWVATDSPGLRDHVADGDGGYLVAPGDESAFVATLLRLMMCPDEADDLGARGRQLVEQRMNTKHQNAALARLLREHAG